MSKRKRPTSPSPDTSGAGVSETVTDSTGNVDPAGEVLAYDPSPEVVVTETPVAPAQKTAVSILHLPNSPWPGDYRVRVGGNTAIHCKTKAEVLGVLTNAFPD